MQMSFAGSASELHPDAVAQEKPTSPGRLVVCNIVHCSTWPRRFSACGKMLQFCAPVQAAHATATCIRVHNCSGSVAQLYATFEPYLP